MLWWVGGTLKLAEREGWAILSCLGALKVSSSIGSGLVYDWLWRVMDVFTLMDRACFSSKTIGM